ncbi:MAG: PAS domain S-box protein [Nitrospirae bacterium]|nr:PAS domain S-box protein [Nitrospirota bacterium]
MLSVYPFSVVALALFSEYNTCMPNEDTLTDDHVEYEAQRFKSIVESSDDSIISRNLKGIIQVWNREAEKIFGYTAQEAIGKPMLILIPLQPFMKLKTEAAIGWCVLTGNRRMLYGINKS